MEFNVYLTPKAPLTPFSIPVLGPIPGMGIQASEALQG